MQTALNIESSSMDQYSDSDDEEAPILVALDEAGPIDESELPPCPVTILSGFLGSGKTTLIQYILKNEHHGKRIAVIENEFGEGLDVESLIARDGSAENNNLTDLLELPNGCVCCTVKDSLVATLESLLKKRQDLDYILIECSGMANPGPIASLFWLDEGLSRLRLDGIITLVDAMHIERQLQSTEEAAQQIAYADRLLLNKVDLITSDKEQSLDDLLHQLNPTARRRSTSFSAVPDLDWILDAKCFDANYIREVEHSLEVGQAPNTDISQCHECNVPSAVIPHRHTEVISTVSLQEEATVDFEKMNKWLATILWPNQDETDQILTKMLTDSDQEHNRGRRHPDAMEIFRIKGILSVGYANENQVEETDAEFVDDNLLDRRRFIVQGVHDLWEVHPASRDLQWNAGEAREVKLVFIGRNLNKMILREGLSACFLD